MNPWDLLIINPLVNALLFLYNVLGHNFGLAIIVFTVLIRVITFPLTYQQQKASKKMAEFQQSDEWKKTQEKYAGNKEKLAQEQMRLMQESGVSPLGGCLPMLIQFPVLIGLYQAINQAMAASPMQLLTLSQHLYPFLPNAIGLIPLNNHFLWLNLGLPDPTYLMTFIVVVTTWIQTKIMTPPPSTDPSAAQMSQTMALMSPLMIGWFSLQFPSGLSLYWIIGNIAGVLQQALTQKVNWRSIFDLGINLSPEPEPETPRRKKRA